MKHVRQMMFGESMAEHTRKKPKSIADREQRDTGLARESGATPATVEEGSSAEVNFFTHTTTTSGENYSEPETREAKTRGEGKAAAKRQRQQAKEDIRNSFDMSITDFVDGDIVMPDDCDLFRSKSSESDISLTTAIPDRGTTLAKKSYGSGGAPCSADNKGTEVSDVDIDWPPTLLGNCNACSGKVVQAPQSGSYTPTICGSNVNPIVKNQFGTYSVTGGVMTLHVVIPQFTGGDGVWSFDLPQGFEHSGEKGRAVGTGMQPASGTFPFVVVQSLVPSRFFAYLGTENNKWSVRTGERRETHFMLVLPIFETISEPEILPAVVKSRKRKAPHTPSSTETDAATLSVAAKKQKTKKENSRVLYGCQTADGSVAKCYWGAFQKIMGREPDEEEKWTRGRPARIPEKSPAERNFYGRVGIDRGTIIETESERYHEIYEQYMNVDQSRQAADELAKAIECAAKLEIEAKEIAARERRNVKARERYAANKAEKKDAAAGEKCVADKVEKKEGTAKDSGGATGNGDKAEKKKRRGFPEPSTINEAYIQQSRVKSLEQVCRIPNLALLIDAMVDRHTPVAIFASFLANLHLLQCLRDGAAVPNPDENFFMECCNVVTNFVEHVSRSELCSSIRDTYIRYCCDLLPFLERREEDTHAIQVLCRAMEQTQRGHYRALLSKHRARLQQEFPHFTMPVDIDNAEWPIIVPSSLTLSPALVLVIRRLQKLVAEDDGAKSIDLVPFRRFYIRHVDIDSDTLCVLCWNYREQLGDNIFPPDVVDYEEAREYFAEHRAAMWEKLFDRPVRGTHDVFSFRARTDGMSVTFEYEDDDDVCSNFDRVLGMDPGAARVVSCAERNTTPSTEDGGDFLYTHLPSKDNFTELYVDPIIGETKKKIAAKKTSAYIPKDMDEVEVGETAVAEQTPKHADDVEVEEETKSAIIAEETSVRYVIPKHITNIDDFLEFLSNTMPRLREVLRVEGSMEVRNAKLMVSQHKSVILDTMATQILGANEEEQKILALFGNAKWGSFSTDVVVALCQHLSEYPNVTVQIIDEWRTSMLPSCCAFKPDVIEKYKNDIAPITMRNRDDDRLVVCKECEKTWNRDDNAATNILLLGEDYERVKRGESSRATLFRRTTPDSESGWKNHGTTSNEPKSEGGSSPEKEPDYESENGEDEDDGDEPNDEEWASL